MKMQLNLGGIVTAVLTVAVSGLFGWFTARTTARNQRAGQEIIGEANVDVATIQQESAERQAERKRMDEQTAWIVGELRKEVERLNTVVQAQNQRIDQLESLTIRMRRELDAHGLEVPKL